MALRSSYAGVVPTSAEIDRRQADGVSWGAIAAGGAFALVVQLMLSLLGLGVGVATANALPTEASSLSSFPLIAGGWWILSGLLASLAGGYMAGRLCGRPEPLSAAYHGLVAWAATTLVVVGLLSTAAGSLVGGAFGMAFGALGHAGQAIASAAPTLPVASQMLPDIEARIRSASGGQDPAELRDVAVSAVRAALTGDEGQRQKALDRAAEALAKAENVPIDQARSQVEDYRAQYQTALDVAHDKAVQAARTAARATSEAAIAAFLALLLGAVGAFWAGRAGAARASRAPDGAF